MSYSQADHDQLELAHDLLHWASELVNGVMERNRTDLTMQMVSFLCEAKRDADLGDAILTEGQVDEALPFMADAEREITMAEKYMDWQGHGKASA